MATYYVYVVTCADTTLYTGVTTDPERRLKEHNGQYARGAKYTQSRRPVHLSYVEPCENRSEAQRREAAIKALSRAQKHHLIDSQVK